ncbi:unnamed protein product [Symbiodinium sp. CCMP2592]|nr:unnamed protein product [Symbiodinium sp. CCMP2592]
MPSSAATSTGLGSETITQDHCYHCTSEPANLWQKCGDCGRFASCFACSQQVHECPRCGQRFSTTGAARTSSSEADRQMDEPTSTEQPQHQTYLIVLSSPALFVYYHEEWLRNQDFHSHMRFSEAAHTDGRRVFVFWRHHAPAMLESMLANPDLQLGIISGSMDIPFLSRIILAILRDGLGWSDARFEDKVNSIVGHGGQIHLLGPECVEACKGGSRKVLAPIMTRFPTFRETSILIVERRGRELVDDDEQDLNTVLVRPSVEDIRGTWAWDVPEDHELWELRECLSQLVESRPADIRVFCSSWALHCKENTVSAHPGSHRSNKKPSN